MPRAYTRTGDKGETGLFSGERVPKDSRRIEAYGTIDELSSSIGHARSCLEDEDIDKILDNVQRDLFVVNAELATLTEKLGRQKATRVEVTEAMIKNLEQEIDALDEELAPLSTLIVPSGTKAATALHVARSTARRAERRTVTLMHEEKINPHIIAYLNRLSSLLFVLARVVNKRSGLEETKWSSQPR